MKIKNLFAWCRILAGCCLLSGLIGSAAAQSPGQRYIPQNLLRDTVYHVSGGIFYGRITRYKEGETIRILEPRGWSRDFKAEEVSRIAWSDRSKIKYAKALISLDSIATTDILYLKDGSMLRGKILAYRPGEAVDFELKAGTTLTIPDAEIKKIVQEPDDPVVLKILERQKKEKVYAFRETGFYSTAVFALLPGGGEYSSEMGLSLQTSFGHQFSRRFGLGLGLSIDGYANENNGDTFLPVFLEARGYLAKKIRSPYWVVAGGYGFPLQTNSQNQEVRRFEGGYMFHPAIGYRLGADKSVNLTIDVGYKFQKALTEREFLFSGEILTRDVVYRRLSLRMSVIF